MFVPTLVLAATLMAQVQPPLASADADEKIKALSFLIGEWEGEGTMQAGPQQSEKAGVKESVKLKLSGKALLIEGLGTKKDADGKEKIIHEALAVISWDGKQNKYVMHAVTARAGAVSPNVEVSDRKLVWSFSTGPGSVRYTINVTSDGKWNEIGEFSPDGSKWNKFFEMTLTKKS